MKTLIFSVVAFLFLTSFFPSDGNRESSSPLAINLHEPVMNLQYRGIYDTILIPAGKNKAAEVIFTSNIAILSASSDSARYIFNDGKSRNILHFCFESEFLEKYRTMIFNNEYFPNDESQSEIFDYSNNRQLDARSPADALIILTEEFPGQKQLIWKSAKTGSGLVQLAELGDDEEWEIDVKNRLIRISHQSGGRLRVRSFPY